MVVFTLHNVSDRLIAICCSLWQREREREREFADSKATWYIQLSQDTSLAVGNLVQLSQDTSLAVGNLVQLSQDTSLAVGNLVQLSQDTSLAVGSCPKALTYLLRRYTHYN